MNDCEIDCCENPFSQTDSDWQNDSPPPGIPEIPPGIPEIPEGNTNVQLDNGECIWMECVPPFCPYPLCTEVNPHG
jgi:hypothetical protein